MSDSLPAAKQAIRLAVQARLAAMTEAQRADAGAQARSLLARQPLWAQAQSILFFAPMTGELDLWPLAQEALAGGKIAALPRYEPALRGYAAYGFRDAAQDVLPGKFGIREPQVTETSRRLEQFDLILVPGVAFDLRGGRLGRGKGFYDRLLERLSGLRCGVAFEQQVVAEVPSGVHDARLDCLLTPSRWRQF